MTTKVTITHDDTASSDELLITQGRGHPDVRLRKGESGEFFVHDLNRLTVSEVPPEIDAAPGGALANGGGGPDPVKPT